MILGLLAVVTYATAGDTACRKGWQQLLLRSRQIHELEADFVQTRTVAVLDRPDVQQGHLSFKAPHTVRWNYEGMEQSATASRLITSVVQATLKGDTVSLNKSFAQDCTLHQNATWLQLIPKERRLKPYIRHILLKINTRGDVIEVLVEETSGDSTHIRLRNLKCY